MEKKSKNQLERPAQADKTTIHPPKAIDYRVNFVSGLCGSTLSCLICSPLDLVKVRLQVSHEKKMKIKYQGILAAFSEIYKEEGIRGFYKGAKAALVTVPVFYAFYFPIYENSKRFFATKLNNDPLKQDYYVIALSALVANTICDLITNPLWVVRVRFMTEFIYSKKDKNETFNVFKEISKLYRKEGILALYSGYTASLLSVHHTIIQFTLYETFKRKAAEKTKKDIKHLPYYYIILSSIVAKVCASFCSYPLEVIRNSLQNVRRHHDSTKTTFRKIVSNIYHRKGFKGFYAGFGLNLFRILPNTAVMFVSYEYLSRHIQDYLEEKKFL